MFHHLFFYLGNTRNRLIENRRRRVIEEGIAVFKSEYEKAEKYGHKDHMKVFNIGLYVLLIENDVSSMKFLIFNEIDEWPKKLVARKLVILLYESSKDLSTLLNKDLRNILNNLPEKKELTEELNEISTEINNFRKEHGQWLSEIRNNCSAHRDNTAIRQLNSIDDIDIHRLQQEVVAKYMSFIRKINTSFMMNLMKSLIASYKKTLVQFMN